MAAYTAIPGDDERPSQSLDQATSSLIREEVRALMRQELQAMRAAPAPAPASTTDEPDGNPPSYDSAAADTSRPAPEEMRSEAARLLSENEPPTDAQPQEPHWFARGFQSLPTGIRFMIIFAPFAAVFVLMPIFCLHGDVLQVTVTAFLMVLANPFIFAIACLISFAFGGVDEGKDGRDVAKKGRTNEAGAMLMTSYWFLTWAAFSWIMWAQYESGDRTMVQRYLLAGRFDAKITQHRALETVTLCIETMIPHRNATIDDLTVCFRKMGMPQTTVP